jgi:hypothetical protein
VGATRLNGPVVSESSAIFRIQCLVKSVSPRDLGLVWGMKRGISDDATTGSEIQSGGPI